MAARCAPCSWRRSRPPASPPATTRRAPSPTRSPTRRSSGISARTTPGAPGPRRRSSRAVKVAVIDSGIDAGNPAFAGRDRRRQVVRRRLLGRRQRRPRHLRRRDHRRERLQRRRHRRHGLQRASCWSPRCCRPTATGPSRRRRGRGDPLGRRPGGAGDQPEPRRPARPQRPRARLLLAGRARRDRVRLRQGRGDRRRCRQRHERTRAAVALSPTTLPRCPTCSASRRSTQNGSVPTSRTATRVYVDLAAPGAGIFSTIPRNLVESTDDPGCAGDPYSNCGPAEFQTANGTSFAAPQVVGRGGPAARRRPQAHPRPGRLAARTFGDRHDPRERLLRLHAPDVTRSPAGAGSTSPARSPGCSDGVALPPPDTLEPDDDTGSEAHALGALPASVSSSEDYWDDPVDVFSVVLHAGERLLATVSSPAIEPLGLRLLKPGTPDLESAPGQRLGRRELAAGRARPLLDVESRRRDATTSR